MDNEELRRLAQEIHLEISRRRKERDLTKIELECWERLKDLILHSPEFKC